jgi:hypothetical protein
MNTPIEDYFDRIFVITLPRRKDRSQAVANLLGGQLGITKWKFFYGYDKPNDPSGRPNGNMGCAASHRALLELIAYNRWKRTLIFEDDIEIAFDSPEMKTLVDPQKLFQEHIYEVPPDWDMIYLGGQYGSKPQRRISPAVIRFNTMLTTSSYGITWQMARKMAPYISGVGPIDSLYGGFQPANKCFIFQPRLFTQSQSFSDLTDRVDDNRPCMLDSHHEEMLIAGAWREAIGGARRFDSEINRREIAGPKDLDGQEVIVDGESFIIESIRLPEHPAPWRRGESITYTLVKPPCSP